MLMDLAGDDRLAPGEILVAAATTPAWTPLFSRAAAIASDGGSLVAHASLISRECGIPAVEALGDATRSRLPWWRSLANVRADGPEVTGWCPVRCRRAGRGSRQDTRGSTGR